MRVFVKQLRNSFHIKLFVTELMNRNDLIVKVLPVTSKAADVSRRRGENVQVSHKIMNDKKVKL